MIPCPEFCDALARLGVRYFTGVPDSLLKDFCACVADTAAPGNHVIAANEGGAVALAAGYHLATGGIGLVYLQNSGLGNLVNPLTSLADPEVCGLPLLLLIGWRGEPGVPDEPQHRKQGRVTPALLDALEVPHAILPDDPAAAERAVAEGLATARRNSSPYALIVRKGTFASYKRRAEPPRAGTLGREAALRAVLAAAGADAVVATTGMASREIYEIRAAQAAGHARDFLCVGGMGHASQIALGVAMQKPARRVWCVDGDGALLMHLGALAIAGVSGAPNFRHVVLNNGAHDSVGGQPTAGLAVDFVAMARACGYRWAWRADTADGLQAGLAALRECEGPGFLEVRVACGARADLGRPVQTPAENKREFMAYVRD